MFAGEIRRKSLKKINDSLVEDHNPWKDSAKETNNRCVQLGPSPSPPIHTHTHTGEYACEWNIVCIVFSRLFNSLSNFHIQAVISTKWFPFFELLIKHTAEK